MSQFSYDCPHIGCQARNVAFRIVHMHRIAHNVGDLIASCGICKASVIFRVSGRAPNLDGNAGAVARDIANSTLDVHCTFPQYQAPDSFEHVPDNVSNAFKEAEANRADGRLLTAAAAYRTTLERVLKQFAASDNQISLYKRIRQVAESQNIPETLTALMDEVRFLGNEVHEDEDPSANDVDAGSEFTKLLLQYLYELPKRVELAAERRAAAKAATED